MSYTQVNYGDADKRNSNPEMEQKLYKYLRTGHIQRTKNTTFNFNEYGNNKYGNFIFKIK